MKLFQRKKNKHPNTRKPCAKCGKEMSMGNDRNVIGVRIQIIADPDFVCTPDGFLVNDFIKKQFGKYNQDIYDFCFECWLDSLFGVNDGR